MLYNTVQKVHKTFQVICSPPSILHFYVTAQNHAFRKTSSEVNAHLGTILQFSQEQHVFVKHHISSKELFLDSFGESFYVKFWTDKRTDRQTPVKQYAPQSFDAGA